MGRHGQPYDDEDIRRLLRNGRGRQELKVVTGQGEPRWYALRVRAQEEYTVAYMLRQQDVFTFVPTEERFRRRTRYVKTKAGFAAPVIPGCVFARFDGEPAWYYLLKNQLIFGVEGSDGQPWQFEPGELYSYFARSLDGCMVFDKGLRMVHVPGRGLLRGPRTQVKVVSHRKREEDEPIVVEPKGQKARLLRQFKITRTDPVKQAA